MSKQYPGGLITKNPVTPSGPYENSTASGIWTLDQQAYWRKLGQWPTAGNPAPDAQFNYVTMLLHGDGTNGAQNNTFLDSSTNNFTITRNGNTTQGSFSPYGSNWSNYFNGSSDNLTFPNNTAFAFGTGSFTIEFWINGPLNNDKFILGGRNAIGTMHITTGGSASTAGVLRYVGTSTIVSSNVITDNTWHHCAIVRNGSSNITLYVDGVSVGTGTDTTNYTTTSGTWYISRNDLGAGNYLNAYISNFRIVKGTAVYTSAFTPSTTPLTAITNTSLLTCQSNRFVDNSANAFAITLEGTPSVQRFNPFGTATAYSTSVIGGSGYFDGTGDYLTVADNAAFNLSSSNFTAECWAYFNSSADQYFFGQIQAAVSNRSFYFAIIASKLFFEVRSGSTGYSITAANNVVLNQWLHIAAVRNGNIITLYQNGVSIGTVSVSGVTVNDSTNLLGVGCGGGYVAEPMIGYMTDARLVVGTAVYTANFTPPTAPLTAITNTQLLTSFTNGAIFDNAMMNDLETVGNAQISTSVVKYGTGSLYFDGTGDDLSAPNLVINSLGSGAFTIEMWVYRLGNGTGGSSAYDALLGSNVDNVTSNYGVYVTRSSGVINFFSSAGLVSSSNSLSNSTWTHVAICRTSADNLQIFINGVSGYSATYTGTGTLTFPFFVASDNTFNGNSNFYGYIDELRITKGYARYTANFTPPTAAFFNTGPY